MSRFGSLGTQYFDNSGDVLSGGKIFFYESGTTTNKPTYADINEETANTNPVILTAAGRQPNIFFRGTAKAVLTTSAGVIIETRDPVGAGSVFAAFDSWSSTFTYGIGDITTASDLKYYVSLTTANQGNDPAADANPADWTLIDFIRTWNTNETYAVDEIAKGSDGELYIALVAQAGNNPVSDYVNWRQAGLKLNGVLKSNGNQVQWSKGADVASATALPVLTDGNYFDVTGTTTIASINTTSVGTVIKLHFDAALTLTHNATSLVLPSALNIITAANDEAEFIEYSTGNYRCTSYTRASGQPVLGGIILGTPVATTTGTSIDFTGIPPGVNRVSLNFNGVSNSAAVSLRVQIGDSGGIETAGYITVSMKALAAGLTYASPTAGFDILSPVAGDSVTGTMTLSLENASTNTWCCNSQLGSSNFSSLFFTSGRKSLSAVLDRVRLTTASGSDAFDAGEINISYE